MEYIQSTSVLCMWASYTAVVLPFVRYFMACAVQCVCGALCLRSYFLFSISNDHYDLWGTVNANPCPLSSVRWQKCRARSVKHICIHSNITNNVHKQPPCPPRALTRPPAYSCASGAVYLRIWMAQCAGNKNKRQP